MKHRLPVIFIFLLVAIGCGKGGFSPSGIEWQLFQMETPSSLRGISIVSDEEVWLCGNGGFVARSTDGGSSWVRLKIAGADSADFRDVHAFPGGTAYLLQVGIGQSSAIYKTIDGGKTWTLQFRNPFEEGFFSGMAFWDSRRGLAFSDPVAGKFVVIRTVDGGNRWEQIPPEGMPPAFAGEYGFAGSGTCIIARDENRAVFATGGSAARVFLTQDGGETWQVTDTPIRAGEASTGIFSLAMKNRSEGLAVGGDYRRTGDRGQNLAKTTNGGRTWVSTISGNTLPFQSCVISLEHWQKGLWVSVGPAGSYFSNDDGEHWTRLADQGFHTCGIAPGGQWVWAAGSEGRVARFRWVR